MAREMLKLRKGDSAIMIKADGEIEMAGVHDKPIVSADGKVSPVVLFAAAWAKKDDSLLCHLVKNFQDCVREGYFGEEAKNDFKKAEIETEKKKLIEEEKERLKELEVKKEERMKELEEKYDPKQDTDESEDSESGIVKTNADAADLLNEKGATPENANEILNTPRSGEPEIIPNVTPEEMDKQKEEERKLKAIADQGQDHKVKKQLDVLKSNSKVISKSDSIDGYVNLPDLPVEQTMKYQKASPEEQVKMKAEQDAKEQTIGNATIEEN